MFSEERLREYLECGRFSDAEDAEPIGHHPDGSLCYTEGCGLMEEARERADRIGKGRKVSDDDVGGIAKTLSSGKPVVALTGAEFQKDGVPLTEKVVRFWNEQNDGKVNVPGVGEVEMNLKSVQDDLGHKVGKAKCAAFAAVADVMRGGTKYNRYENWKGRDWDTMVIGAPISISSVPHICEAIIKRDSNGKWRLYNHECEPTEMAKKAWKGEGMSRLIISELVARGDVPTKDAALRYLALCQDESWEEHKKHYHGGKEPTGECEWIDNDQGDSFKDGLEQVIKKAKEISKEIENGNWIHQRCPKTALRGVQEGGRVLSEASYVARGAETPVGVAPRAEVKGEKTEFSRVGRAAGARQERVLEAYARREGIWTQGLDEELTKKFGKAAEGCESMAFFDTKNGVVEKLITTRMYEQPIENLDRIALHNWLFPETAMKVVGFGRTKAIWNPNDTEGLFVIHVKQPLIQIAGSASDEDIDKRMESMGFSKVPKKNEWDSQRWLSEDGAVVVDDLHEENAVYDGGGRFCVIDADLRLNTPRLGYGGKYVFEPLKR